MWLKLLCLVICIVGISCGCQSGWQQHENKCFRYFQTKVNYKNAIQVCKVYNATLVSVHSREEFNFLEDIARHYSTGSGVHWVWLGGQRLKNNNRTNEEAAVEITTQSSNKWTNQSVNSAFRWQDGTSFNYSEWRYNCPDQRKDEDCILMSIFQSRPSHWCNYKCDSNQDHVICQYYLPEGDPSLNNSVYVKEDRNQTDLMLGEGSCDVGWTLNDNSCYKFFETNQTWQMANAMCMRNAASLLSINSEAEQMFVQNFLFTISGALEAVWLGAKRKGNKNEFLWIDNTTFGYQNWAPHEPDFRNNRELCLAMNNVDEFYGLWLDAPCSIMFSVACKKKAKRVPGCSTVELLNEAQKAIQMNDFIIQLLQRITNRIDEVSQSPKDRHGGKENSAVAMEIKSEVDSILQNASIIRLSIHLSIFISLVLIFLMIFVGLFLFKRRHLIKKPYLSIFSFKNLNYEEKNQNTNEYEELLFNHNLNPNAASSSNSTRNVSDKV